MKINNIKQTIDLAEYGETYILRNELSFLGDNIFEKTLEKFKPLVSINPLISRFWIWKDPFSLMILIVVE